MKIRKKTRSRKSAGRSTGRGVFLDRPGEFLSVFCANLEDAEAHPEPGRASLPVRGRPGKWRKSAWMSFCVLLILSLASMKVHGWGWAEEAFDFWKPPSVPKAAPATAMSEDGLLDAVVSLGWAEHLFEGRRAAAGALLDSWTDGEALTVPARKTLRILEWLTSLKLDDPDVDGGFVFSILEDGSRLPRRLEFWERRQSEIRAVVAKLIGRNVPESLGKRIYHRIDLLQNRAYLYLGDIRELKREIEDAVGADRPLSLFPLLEKFRKRHPDVGGIEELRADLEAFEAIRESVREGRMDRARQIRDGHAFVSEIVARKAAAMFVLDEIRDFSGEEMSAQPGTPKEIPWISSRSLPPGNAKPLSSGSVRLSDLEIRKPQTPAPALGGIAGENGGGQ